MMIDRAGVPHHLVDSLDVMKLVYKPFGIVFGILAGVLSKKLFDAVWGIFDKEEPPKPTTQPTTWPK